MALLKESSAKRAVSALVDASPIGYFKLYLEALNKKTADGQTLTPAGQLMDGIVAATGILSFLLAYEQDWGLATAYHAAAWLGWTLMYTPDIFLAITEKLEQKITIVKQKVNPWLKQSKSVWFLPEASQTATPAPTLNQQ